jgi:deoxycytidylate deaminase
VADDSDPEFESELIIGLVCAVGAEKSLIVDLLKERLGRAGYAVRIVKISRDVIPLLQSVTQGINDNFKRISDLMDAGNAARAAADDDSVLALGVAAQIFSQRGGQAEQAPMSKTAFIVDSLKRPEEVEKLRAIYPEGFVLVGIHESQTRRRDYLTGISGLRQEDADKLIQRDAEESKIKHGQRVNKTFHLADFFVKISKNHDVLRSDINRIVDLWFGNPFITPTFDEHAMFLAFSAALRSADLSRQVGAVVTKNSQVLSTGANDCPQAGGGLYWPTRDPRTGAIGDSCNGRDHMREVGDSNRAEQLRIIDQIVQEGIGTDYKLDEGKLRKLLEQSVIGDLTEFGRVVHAEMEAILSCSRAGISTVATTLYCTTFPCHNCAKHIIAAGVERVVYIEPYPKSKALDFHDDSITTSKDNSSDVLVLFDAFVGIGPRRFFDLFSMHLSSSYRLFRKDKETGKAAEWKIDNARLRIQMKPASYLDLEAHACKLFGKAKDSQNLMEDKDDPA